MNEPLMLEKTEIQNHYGHKAEYNRTEMSMTWYLCECGEEIPVAEDSCG